MVNLKKLRIRVSGPLPYKFRKIVRQAITVTLLEGLNRVTMQELGTKNFRKIWKLVYVSYYGFYIIASDTTEYKYACIAYWNNHGTGPHIIPGPERRKFNNNPKNVENRKFLMFKADPKYVKKTKTFSENIAFVKKIEGVDCVFTLMVHHPGIKEKRFIEKIIFDGMSNLKVFNIVENYLDYKNVDNITQFKIFDKLRHYKYKYVERLSQN